jgi:thiosulfate/3-mercaptopyruvate sulfurtransferase
MIAKSPLIEAQALFDLMQNPKINEGSLKILDASFAMPGADVAPYDIFLQGHIEGARFFDIDLMSDQSNPLPHMLPSPEQFARQTGALGISNADTVIIYGQSGIIMGPARAWWMFRVFGHDNVRVLNGGIPAWKSQGFALQPALPEPASSGAFHAQFRRHLVVDHRFVTEAIENKSTNILDARSPERFKGLAPEPRPGLASGHMPGAFNIPASILVDSATGKLKSPDELRFIFDQAGFDITKPIVTTCGSGVTACVIALALFTVGYPDIPVYDGSWSEWGQYSQSSKKSQSNK